MVDSLAIWLHSAALFARFRVVAAAVVVVVLLAVLVDEWVLAAVVGTEGGGIAVELGVSTTGSAALGGGNGTCAGDEQPTATEATNPKTGSTHLRVEEVIPTDRSYCAGR